MYIRSLIIGIPYTIPRSQICSYAGLVQSAGLVRNTGVGVQKLGSLYQGKIFAAYKKISQ